MNGFSPILIIFVKRHTVNLSNYFSFMSIWKPLFVTIVSLAMLSHYFTVLFNDYLEINVEGRLQCLLLVAEV